MILYAHFSKYGCFPITDTSLLRTPLYYGTSLKYMYLSITDISLMSQSILWVPPPPPPQVFVGHLSFWRKNVANAPTWGPNNTTKSPSLGNYIDANAPPLGTKYKFSEDFWTKKLNAGSVFKIDSVAISFKTFLIAISNCGSTSMYQQYGVSTVWSMDKKKSKVCMSVINSQYARMCM
jgi:hypothetical protein